MIFGIIAAIILVIVISYLNSPKNKGKNGEKIVAEVLSNINSNSKTINNISINDNGKSRQIDHIFISEYGVFVIETKNYAGTIYGKETSENWKQYLNGKSFEFKNPIHQNYGHYQIVKKILEDETENIFPVVVFIKRCTLKAETISSVIYHDEIKNYIISKEKVLNINEIQNIYDILMENKIENEDALRNHEYNVKKYIEYKNTIADKGKCPRCDGKLVLRNSRRGKFYGCSNYPKCRYTKNIY